MEKYLDEVHELIEDAVDRVTWAYIDDHKDKFYEDADLTDLTDLIKDGIKWRITKSWQS